MSASTEKLALYGGLPIRQTMLPYSRQWVNDDDLAAVSEVLQSDWLTTGPKVSEFERDFADFVGSDDAVAVSSGTAALHAAIYAADIGPGDEVIVPSMTFVATANCVVYQGATPIFVDVEPDTLLIDPEHVESSITSATKCVMAVDYAGQPCDYDALVDIADRHSLTVVSDACHSIGASYQGRSVGTLGSLSAFSFHPVKNFTTGEGGIVTTNDTASAKQMRAFRNHGITSDHRERSQTGDFSYEMVELGFNYRISDIHCALGISQLHKLPGFVEARQRIAAMYDAALSGIDYVTPLAIRRGSVHAYHLYPVLFDTDILGIDRAELFRALRSENIGVNVHYRPVHLHQFYQKRYGTRAGVCPIAEAAYDRLISLPIFPQMADLDVDDVVAAIRKLRT